MCRVFGCVAAEPVSIRHELLEAENPHDPPVGGARLRLGHGRLPAHRRRATRELMRFPQAAFEDEEFLAATETRGRIFNVHVRRATMGGLSLENTHPFVLGNYSYCHNGTIIRYPRLARAGRRRRAAATPTRSTSSTS